MPTILSAYIRDYLWRVFIRSSRAICLKIWNLEAAWSLLNGLRLAFVPTKLGRGRQKEEEEMLWTIFVILLVLWLLGVVSSYTVGGFIHILLVLALVVLLINIIGGRRTVV